MTPILLPLVASLASVGINMASMSATDGLRSGKVDLEYFSSQDPVNGASVDAAVGDVLAGASYPEAYRWTGSTYAAELGKSGGPVSQARLASGDSSAVVGIADLDGASDEEFSWTGGVGGGGIGFRYRFR